MATAESIYAIYPEGSNPATLGGAPDELLTPEQADLREIVDDMFEQSDAVVHSIMHAIHAKSEGDPYWLADPKTGIWRKANEEEKAAMIAQEVARHDTATGGVAKETAGELVVASAVQPEREGARVYLFPLREGWETERAAASS